VAPQPNDYCFTDGSVSPSISASHSTDPSFPKYQCLEGTVNLPQTPQMPSSNTSTETSLPPQTQNSFVSGPRTSTVSEALFVRIIVSRCKRIAPLWFRGISSMRERNREENRRTSTNAGQTQNDWSIISGKIREMNQIMETDTVVNLLKKLHKELPADSVLKFIKCWLGDADALNDPDSCVLSRPDAKGRMRRIDGGKGSDKRSTGWPLVRIRAYRPPISGADRACPYSVCRESRPRHFPRPIPQRINTPTTGLVNQARGSLLVFLPRTHMRFKSQVGKTVTLNKA
uniref:CTF/NF-I domain-containing protein n=1 Tax=Mesocestoides corti TaxID=53468 RepID=A0A5K3FH18_MESCO